MKHIENQRESFTKLLNRMKNTVCAFVLWIYRYWIVYFYACIFCYYVYKKDSVNFAWILVETNHDCESAQTSSSEEWTYKVEY